VQQVHCLFFVIEQITDTHHSIDTIEIYDCI